MLVTSQADHGLPLEPLAGAVSASGLDRAGEGIGPSGLAGATHGHGCGVLDAVAVGDGDGFH